MILFYKSFLNTISSLSWIDIVFFAAVLFLIILIVSLIYFIMINNEDDSGDKPIKKVSEEKKPAKKENVIAIIDSDIDPNEEGELLDLNAISKKLEEKKNNAIDLTNYEEEQEKKAIISYDELLARKNDYDLNYEDEENLGDITVKKIDLEDLNDNKVKNVEEVREVKVISYEKEEAFLEALKKLQEQIN